MIISEMAIPAHTIVGALNLDTSFKINLKSATIIQYTIKGRFMSR